MNTKYIAFDIDMLMLDIDNHYGLKYIYPSMFSIMSNSKENLQELTESLKNQGIFNFRSGKTYEGVEPYYKLFWVYDEGMPLNSWIIKLAKYITSLNNEDSTEAILRVDKDRILRSDLSDMSIEFGETVDEPEKYIDTYVNQLRKLLRQYRLDSILKTDIVSKTYKSLEATIADDKIYIVEK